MLRKAIFFIQQIWLLIKLKRFDHNGDGEINANELAFALSDREEDPETYDLIDEVLRELKYRIRFDNVPVDTIFQEYDKNQGKVLDYPEFEELVKKIDPKLNPAQINSVYQRLEKRTKSLTPDNLLWELKRMPESFTTELERVIIKLSKIMDKRSTTPEEEFRKVDLNQGGMIDLHQFERMIRNIMPSVNRDQIWFIFRRFDKNNDERISCAEFNEFFQQLKRVDALIREMNDKAEEEKTTLEAIFMKYDNDNNDFLDFEECKKMIMELVPDVKDNLVRDFYRRFDHDGDGLISLAEFIKTLKKASIKASEPPGLREIKFYIRLNNISVKDLIEKFDFDRNGALNEQEFRRLLSELDPSKKITRSQLEEIFNHIDTNGDKSISCTEFINVLNKIPEPFSHEFEEIIKKLTRGIKDKKGLREIFKKIDSNQDGAVNIAEFGRFIRENIDSNLTEEQVWFLFRRFDNNRDNHISVNEFIEFCEKLEDTNELLKKIKNICKEKDYTYYFKESSIDQKEGALELEEMMGFLRFLDKNLTSDQCRALFFRFDYDGDGEVSCSEFIKVISETEEKEGDSKKVGTVLYSDNKNSVEDYKLMPIEDEDPKLLELKLILRANNQTLADALQENGLGKKEALDQDDFRKLVTGIDSRLSKERARHLYYHIDQDRKDIINIKMLNMLFDRMPEPKTHEVEEAIRELVSQIDGNKKKLESLFTLLDVDGNNKVNYEEFNRFALSINKRMERKNIWFVFRRFDTDGDMSINREEFLRFFDLMGTSEGILRRLKNKIKKGNISPAQLFKQADSDKSGEINQREFFIILRNQVDPNIEEDQVDALFKRFDHNRDGTIGPIEFIRTLEASDKPDNQSQEPFSDSKLLSDIKITIKIKNMSVAKLLKKYDKDNSGVLEFDEFWDLLKSIKENVPRKEAKELFRIMDKDGDKALTKT